MASTRVTPAEEIRRLRAFCKKSGIKFTLVRGPVRPWTKPEGTFVKVGPWDWPYLKNLNIAISKESLGTFFDECEEFSRKQADSVHRKQIQAYAAAARDVLTRGDVDGAIRRAAALAHLLDRPFTETGRKVSDTVRKIHQDRYGTPAQKARKWAAHVATFEEIRAKNGWDVKSSEKEAAKQHGVSPKSIQRARKWARERESHVTRR